VANSGEQKEGKPKAAAVGFFPDPTCTDQYANSLKNALEHARS
jgi:hypothetical protein